MLKFTKEQESVIHFDKPTNLLVSASAGSGKTEVMTSRIVELIKKGISLSSLFVSTFTVKAAEEMQTRIESKLKKEIETQSENVTLQKRLTVALQELPLAVIGTTDSFTQQLVKENYPLLNLDPNFRILTDKSEQDILKSEVLDDLIEKYLSEDKSGTFKELLKNFSSEKNLKTFKESVNKIYNFCQSTGQPEDWIENNFLQAIETYKTVRDLPFFETTQVLADLNSFYQALESHKEIFSAASRQKVDRWLLELPDLLSKLGMGDISDFFNQLSILLYSKDTALNGTNFTSKAAKELELDSLFYQVLGGKSKDREAGSVRVLLEKYKFVDLMEGVQPEVREIAANLQSFILDFYHAYLEQKRKQNAYEFSDITHFAIKILSEHADIRQAYQERFTEIMVDEYQDTNAAQERLYRLLSTGQNLFMVGDIKQSIYGFRQADPEIFNEKYQQRADVDNDVVVLGENFRSRKEILDFINAVFSHLMDEKIYKVVYAERDYLIYGGDNDSESFKLGNLSPLPELLLYQQEEEGEKEAVEQEELDIEAGGVELSSGEINLTARKIVTLINDYQVQPQDIAVLVRSKSNNNLIKKVFEAAQIPVVLDEGTVNYLKSIEVILMLDVLRAVNNPLFDIPLVATLRSPLFHFDENELVAISQEKGETFWEKIQAVKADSKLYSKVYSFTETFTHWRELATTQAIYKVLWKIYEEENYFHYVGALPNGEQRQANLTALVTRAAAYEANGYKGLVKFIDMIDNFLADENDLEDVATKLPQNAVRVLTMHKSKGLQFPYVFIMNMQSQFNQRDLKDLLILDKDQGIGLKFIKDMRNQLPEDFVFPYARVRMETLPYLANRELKERQSLAEEMRILYVAMTRAIKKLYLVGKVKNLEKIQTYQSAKFEGEILGDSYRRKASDGFLGWILALQKKLEGLFILDVSSENRVAVPLDEKRIISESLEEESSVRPFDFSYAHEAATKLPSTQTPSMVKRRALQLYDERAVSDDRPFEILKFGKTGFIQTELGTAVHQLLYFFDFSDPTKEKLREVLDGLDYSQELKEAIDLDRILTLFDTDFGRLLQENAKKVVKEAPFSMLKTDEMAHEQYVVRGIIDGYIDFGDHILLFDYKTDSLNHRTPEDLMREYDGQQALYAEALSKANRGKGVERYLILLGGVEKAIIRKL